MIKSHRLKNASNVAFSTFSLAFLGDAHLETKVTIISVGCHPGNNALASSLTHATIAYEVTLQLVADRIILDIKPNYDQTEFLV